VLLREAFGQECVVNWAWERNIHGPAEMHVSEFGVCETELPPAKAVRMNRYAWPCGYLFFELSHLHHLNAPHILDAGSTGSIQDCKPADVVFTFTAN
jgi:hypothetical protein